MFFALVVCNGEPPDSNHLVARSQMASLVVAADGGIVPLLHAGVTPHVVIGDLDSSSTPYPEGVLVVMDPDQETNDLEKALNYVLASGLSNVLVLGATGLRLDQTLKNLSVLVQFSDKFERLHFEDRLCSIRIADKNTELTLPLGTDISLFPMSGKVDGIVTHGLVYPLVNESLENGSRDGTSNVTSSNPVSIQYETGSLLLIINHDSYPNEWP
jgi:thiamine pyrophosphokinase